MCLTRLASHACTTNHILYIAARSALIDEIAVIRSYYYTENEDGNTKNYMHVSISYVDVPASHV